MWRVGDIQNPKTQKPGARGWPTVCGLVAELNDAVSLVTENGSIYRAVNQFECQAVVKDNASLTQRLPALLLDPFGNCVEGVTHDLRAPWKLVA